MFLKLSKCFLILFIKSHRSQKQILDLTVILNINLHKQLFLMPLFTFIPEILSFNSKINMKTYSINQGNHFIIKNGKLVKKELQPPTQNNTNYRVISYNPSKLIENVSSSAYDQETIKKLNKQINQLKKQKTQMLKQIQQNKDVNKLRFQYQSQIEQLRQQNIRDKKRFQEKLEALQRHYSERGKMIQNQALQISVLKSNCEQLQDYIDQLVTQLEEEKKKQSREIMKVFNTKLNTAALREQKKSQQLKTIRKQLQSPIKPLCHKNDRIRTMQSDSGNDLRKSIIYGMMNIGTVRNTQSSHNMFQNCQFVKHCDSQDQIPQVITVRKQRNPNL